MSAKIVTAGGFELPISDLEYSKFLKKARRAGWAEMYVFDDGTIIPMTNLIAVCPPETGMPPAAVGDVMTPVANLFEAPVFEATLGVSQEESDENKIDANVIRKLKEKHKLTDADFAASVGYSQATLRMALKGDRVSQEFSDAVKAKYPDWDA